MIELPIEKLRELFDYDSGTGILTHRSRSSQAFSSKQAWRAWQARYAGKPAGWRQKGYLIVAVSNNGQKLKISVHRLIWALVHSRWPAHEIDHKDGDGLNNRLANLREATKGENNQNRTSSPTRGTVFDATSRLRRRFRAYITINRKQIWLGCFSTRAEAHAAYLAGKARLHTFQPVPRETEGR